jgi:hypothetical protein
VQTTLTLLQQRIVTEYGRGHNTLPPSKSYQVDDGVGAPSLVGVDLQVAAEVPGVQPRQRKSVAVSGQRNGSGGNGNGSKVLKN